tara:strand:+ start:174 stop:3248 length:3075 start_codon:yes stop_codon:yes gene_type:complete
MNRILLLVFFLISFLELHAQNPNWTLNPSEFQYSMNITSIANVNGDYSNDQNDVIAVFDGEDCVGIGTANYIGSFQDQDVSYFFITLYSNQLIDDNYNLKIYDASLESVFDGVESVSFVSDDFIGSIADPIQYNFGDITCLQDTDPPQQILFNESVYLDENGTVTLSYEESDLYFDECDINYWDVSQTVFDCSSSLININIEASDISGNISQGIINVSVLDTISPVIVDVPQNITHVNIPSLCYRNVSWTEPTSSDNCSVVSFDGDWNPNDYFGVGQTTVTYTAEDLYGNITSNSFNVIVNDNEDPQIMVNETVNRSLNEDGIYILLSDDVDNGSFDNCSIANKDLSQTTFDCSNIGDNKVLYSISDPSGNESMDSLTVNISDNTPPILITNNINVILDNNNNASIITSDLIFSSSDNCAVDTMWLNDYDFNCSDVGQQEIFVTISDVSGNLTTQSTIVTVVDNSPPIAVTQSVTGYLNDLGEFVASASDFEAGSYDNCGIATININEISNSIFPIETTSVVLDCENIGSNELEFNIYDNFGNSSSDLVELIVLDTISPTIIVEDVSVELNANGEAFLSFDDVDNGSFDNCSIVSETLSNNIFTIENIGLNNVQVQSIDQSGNIAIDNVTVNVLDNIPPLFTFVPNDTVLSVDSSLCGAYYFFPLAEAEDNGSVVISSDISSGSFFELGSTTITFTATDIANNQITTSFTITVIDDEEPVVTFVPDDVVIAECFNPVIFDLPQGIDNCSDVSILQVSGIESNSIFPVGTTINEFALSDGNGNTTYVSFNVTVLEQINLTPISIDPLCQSDSAINLLTLNEPGFYFDGENVSEGIFDPNLAEEGTSTINFQYTDTNGCISTGEFHISIFEVPDQPIIIHSAATTLTATAGGLYYQWSLNNIDLPGETNQFINIVSGGSYSVIIFNENNCWSESELFNIGATNLNKENFDFNQPLVFPNPTKDILWISTPESWKNIIAELYSISGDKIITKNIDNSFINLVELPAGRYLLNINQEDKNYNKIIIKK